MYYPWEPSWFHDIDDPLTLEQAKFRSLLWIEQVIDSKARSAKARIAESVEAHKSALGSTARRVGMRAAMDAALAQMPDAHTLPDSWIPNRVAATRWRPATLRERVVHHWRFTPRRIGRNAVGRLSQGLRAAARWLDDNTYGW